MVTPGMSETTLRVDIFSDIACPWCYIGKRRFERAVASLEFADQIQVHWHAYQLDPSLPEHYPGSEHEYLCQAKGMDPADVTRMMEHVTEQAAGEGLNYDFAALRPGNSFTALRLLAYAKTLGKGDQLKEALLSAHFERGLDTADVPTLASLAAENGLDAATVTELLGSTAYSDEVNADIDQARQLGINSVPFFVLEGKYGISGAQPSENFASALRQVHAELSGPAA